LARAQLKLNESTLQQPFADDHLLASRPTSQSLEAPAFPRRPALATSERWQRHTFNWSAVIAAFALAAPIAAGALLGHVIAGIVVGTVALVAVGLLTFGLYILNNTLPF